MTECVHEWSEGELYHEDYMGSHPCVYCENCEYLVDLTVTDDPREV
jgi:hypothetical protein